jgi:hypothetical protein
MKARMSLRQDGKYFVWNYWEPAGPWDYKPDGAPKHWVGVHPNGGYYAIDVEGIVSAFEHDLIFTKADIDRLIATNRTLCGISKYRAPSFNASMAANLTRAGKDSPGVLWTALRAVPYEPHSL